MAVFYGASDYKRPADEENSAPEPYRSAFRRDYARLIHSPAFRRLQGKTQLFPGLESDFFRNRLTHSLEVAQIAKSIGFRLNDQLKKEGHGELNLDLIETAALAHDLGHPPFGHNGEKALDACMKKVGGFEGNAQTLRILSVLEKKRAAFSDGEVISEDGIDGRFGLNLTYRSLAAVLKYDKPIPINRRSNAPVVKGYFKSEEELVAEMKSHVSNKNYSGKFSTIECQIMDIADDIAYSTYDLEDAFKAGFLSPLDMVAAQPALIELVAQKSYDRLYGENKYKKLSKEKMQNFKETITDDIISTFEIIGIFDIDENQLGIKRENFDFSNSKETSVIASQIYRNSKLVADVGYARTEFTSQIVGQFIRGISINVLKGNPPFSKLVVNEDTKRRIEIFKNFTFESLIMSTRLKVAEYRGYGIIKTIFENLDGDDHEGDDGYLLLPDDFRNLYERYEGDEDESKRKRVICDFIAGMTDRYAIEFYGRLKSEKPESIFKPL